MGSAREDRLGTVDSDRSTRVSAAARGAIHLEQSLGSAHRPQPPRLLVADAIVGERGLLEEVVARTPAAALLVWGAEHHIRLINGRWLEAFGERDALGRTLSEEMPDVASVLAPLLERVYATGEPFRGTDVRFPGRGQGTLNGSRFFTLTVSPIRGREHRVDGALIVGMETTDEVRRRRSLEQELATERGIADVLQRSLLPSRFPEIPGLTFAARYVPGGAEAGVGGDWYDVIPLGGERVGFVIGDITGHGVTSASTMGLVRHALRAYAADGHGPAGVMRRLDRLLAPQEQIATVLYGELDAATRRLVFVSAGHPPVLVAGREGTTQYLSCPWHTPLGTGLTADYEETVRVLEPDFTLILYTDGLVEDRSRSILHGLERLRHTVAVCTADVETLCDHVLATLRPGDGGPDDLALLVLRDRPLSCHALRLEVPARPESLERLRTALRVWLRDVGATPEEAGELVTACGEACMNAVVHAYAITPGTLELEAQYRDGVAEITVRDWGRWRSPRGGPGGHGFALMRAMSDTVERRSSASGTEVRLRRRLRSAGAT